jgi:hypothetical protein
MRVLITGSRTWTDRRLLYTTLSREIVLAHQWEKGVDGQGNFVDWIPPDDFVLVTGACPTGADVIARDWMIGWDKMPEEHPADWDKYHKTAGFFRNEVMVNLGADLCIGFLMRCIKRGCTRGAAHWSHGTVHTLGLCDEAGINTLRIYGEAP